MSAATVAIPIEVDVKVEISYPPKRESVAEARDRIIEQLARDLNRELGTGTR